MASIDYSRFKNIGLEEEREENEVKAKKLEERKKKLALEQDDDLDDKDLHPLFWENIPETQEADEYTKVFTDMIYEDRTPDQLALDFKDKGNEAFKWGAKFYDNALKYYGEGLHWCTKGDTSDEENRKCYVALLSNRAAINLKRRNYGSVVKDCSKAAACGRKYITNCKLYYRAAKAFYALRRYKEAKIAVEDALRLDSENKLLVKLKKQVDDSLEAEKKKKREKELEQMRAKKLDNLVRRQCIKRGIKVGPLIMDIGHYTQKSAGEGKFPRPVVHSDSGVEMMSWNAMLMYPEFSTSDYIQEWHEHITFREQLSLMFPATSKAAQDNPELVPEWDRDNTYYTVDKIKVYFEERYVRPFDMSKMWEKQYAKSKERELEEEDYTKKHRVEVKLDRSLLDALSDPQYVVPGVPVFYIVSTASPYFEIYKKQHAGRFRII